MSIIDTGFMPDKNKYIAHLREMVSVPTISEKEHYRRESFDSFNAMLKNNYPLTFSRAEEISVGNGTFLCIRGSNPVSPLMLMSHKDVVHEGKKKWKAPAFEGKVINGKMYGRGTFDCKGSLCCLFEAVESLLSEGYEFKEDLYILSTSNEEIAGSDAPDAVKYLKDNGIVPGLLIDEGGAILKIPFPSKVKDIAMIGAVERSSARLIFDCPEGTDAKKTGKSITRKKYGHFEITPEVEELAKGLSEYLKFPVGNIFGALAKYKSFGKAVLTHAGSDARAFCGASTGFGIPKGDDAAGAKNPLRISVSGNYYNKLDELVKQVGKTASDMGLRLVSSTAREADTPVSSSSKGFTFITKTAKDVFDSIAVLPYPVLGRTDARYFVGYAQDVIRFIPLEISLSQMMKFHCPNENIYVDSLTPAVKFYREAIKKYNSNGKEG